MVTLIALSHQDSLVLELRFLQFGTTVKNLIAQFVIAEPCYDLTFLDILSQLINAKHNDLF